MLSDYTKILEVNLFAFAYRLFHRDFSPINGAYCIGTHSCSVIMCFITSLAKEIIFLVALVCLSVCLFVCGQHYSKRYERIGVQFYGGVLGSTMKN